MERAILEQHRDGLRVIIRALIGRSDARWPSAMVARLRVPA